MMNRVDVIEQTEIRREGLMPKETLSEFNKNFRTNLKPENGLYGVTEVIKDDGSIQRTGKNASGHLYREYLLDGKVYRRREILGDGYRMTTLYDDNGTPYLKEVSKSSNKTTKMVCRTLSPNTTIVKNNFTAVTDSYGRPILNKVTDLQLNTEKRVDVTKFRDSSYKAKDQGGHLIAHIFGGTSGKENIVAQLDDVNLSKMKRVENIVKDLKKQGHRVDYEVKSNYTGSKNPRPSSFEPKITVDGKEYTQIPNDLKKIYNSKDPGKLRKTFVNVGEKYGVIHETSKKSGLVAAGLTFTVSTVDNVSAYVDGKITAEEMVTDIVGETATAGTIGYGTTFISSSVSQAMSKSSSALISRVGGSCLPAAMVSFAVESYDSVESYAKGEIDGVELAYDLGENATGVAGGFAGGAIVGAAAGSVAGPAGTVAGGIVGGVVGCVVATEAYATAVEIGSEGAEVLAEKAQELASNTVELVTETIPDAASDVKEAFTDFANNVKLPFSLG